MGQLYTNNASTRLAIAIDALDTSLVLDAGTGALFPQPVAPEDYFLVSLEDTAGLQEICKCISRAADTLIVERAQEGTTAIVFASQSRVECRLTAGTMANLMTADNPVVAADLNLGGFALINGEIVAVPMRGDSGVTTNQIVVPSGGGEPTIGGSKIWNAGNDGPASGLDADTLDGFQASDIAFPAGTRMLFHQAAPPAGWTIDPAITNHALRVVGAAGGGSAGATNFTSVFGAGKTTGNHSLSVAEMPSHSHNSGVAGNTASTWAVYSKTSSGTPGAATQTVVGEGGDEGSQAVTSTSGSGSGHNHTLSLDIKYINTVIGVKN